MILARVQGHPSRTHLHERLLPLLSPLETQVFLHESDPPNPWEGYKACLTDIPVGPTHLLVIQDDAVPAVGFAAAAERIAVANPERPVCLFMGALPSSTAARVRRSPPHTRYVTLGPASFMPLVCVLWPTHVARSFLSWAERNRVTRADDANAARWMKATRTEVMVAVPSIVQHDDDAPSVKGGREHKPWTESWRYALNLTTDASEHDW